MSSKTRARFPLWLKMILLAIVGVIVAVALSIAWLFYGSRMDRSGDLTVAGLGETIEIGFDVRGVPYVDAGSLEDAFFSLGFLHARQRLWQMDLFRRAGHARLSELLGQGMLETDQAMFWAGLPALRDQLRDNASPQLLEVVAAYTGGVNAGIDSQRQPPPEYLIARVQPAPWTPDDVFAVGALLAFDPSGNLDREMLRLTMAQVLDAEHMAPFLVTEEADPDFPHLWWPADEPEELPEEALSFVRAIAPEARPHGGSIRFGSNGWAVSPERSADGHALFAFDSHDSMGLPNLFYEVHLFFGDQQLRGWSTPGLPVIINGFNQHMAWGYTNIGDSQDLVLLSADPDDPTRFFDGSRWRQARVETIEIPVKGDDPVQVERILSHQGPLISSDPPLALRWTGHEIGSASMDALLDMNLARDHEEFMEAMSRFPVPIANVTWADRSGNIGFRTVGLLPVRRKGDGLMPVVDDGVDPWDGMVPSDRMPQWLNPESGIVAAANARVHGPEWPYLVGNDNAPGWRIRRIKDELLGRGDHDMDSMVALQTDWFNGQAVRDLPRMLALLGEVEDERRAQAVAMLGEWLEDPWNLPDSAAALIFEEWYLALVENVFASKLGEERFRRLMRYNYLVNHAFERLLDDPDHVWWRGQATRLVGQALDAAIAGLSSDYGDAMDEWRLDRHHYLKLRHSLSSAAPWLGRFLDRGPYPMGGGHATVGRAGYRYDRPYDVSNAASVRVVLEMGETFRGKAVIPGGQSGHFLSPHYADQARPWVDNEYFELYGTPADVDGDRLRLVPAQ